MTALALRAVQTLLTACGLLACVLEDPSRQKNSYNAAGPSDMFIGPDHTVSGSRRK